MNSIYNAPVSPQDVKLVNTVVVNNIIQRINEVLMDTVPDNVDDNNTLSVLVEGISQCSDEDLHRICQIFVVKGGWSHCSYDLVAKPDNAQVSDRAVFYLTSPVSLSEDD